MSAYIVTDETISGMMQAIERRIYHHSPYYYWNGDSHYFRQEPAEIAQKLVDENYRSVNGRYDEETQAHAFQFQVVRELTPLEIIKLCNCYRYQACETDDWEQTEAYVIMNELRDMAIMALPGYEEAPWGLYFKSKEVA